jgi:hypothetical protein
MTVSVVVRWAQADLDFALLIFADYDSVNDG